MHAMDAAAVSHIVKYGHRKRTRTLRHQPHTTPQLNEVAVFRPDNILASNHDLPVDFDIIHIVNQPVESLEQCTLAAARRTYDTCYLILRKCQIYILQNRPSFDGKIKIPDCKRFFFHILFHILHVVLSEMISNPAASEAEDQHNDGQHQRRRISPSREWLRHCYPIENSQRQCRCR